MVWAMEEMEDAKYSSNTYLVCRGTFFTVHRRIDVLPRQLVQSVVRLNGSVADAWASPGLHVIDMESSMPVSMHRRPSRARA